jgi:hypothetical protein
MSQEYLTGNPYESGQKTSGFYYIIGRVKSIVLSNVLEGTKLPDPNFKSFEDIGKINFETLYSSLSSVKTIEANTPAYPFFSFLNQYPLVNELVVIFPGPSEKLNDSFEAKGLFYLPPYNIWKFNPNHSAFPNIPEWSKQLQTISTQQNYVQDKNVNLQLFLGRYFKELQDVRKLKPFEGDTIIESRCGQSIRFGSTTPEIKSSNYWSNYGEQGSPITMIINGQGKPISKDPFSPTIENINSDASSIYLTKDQEIVLTDINNFQFRSFGSSTKTQYQSNIDAIVTDKKIISNEIVDANTQDKNSIG